LPQIAVDTRRASHHYAAGKDLQRSYWSGSGSEPARQPLRGPLSISTLLLQTTVQWARRGNQGNDHRIGGKHFLEAWDRSGLATDHGLPAHPNGVSTYLDAFKPCLPPDNGNRWRLNRNFTALSLAVFHFLTANQHVLFHHDG